ncbi:DUF177 domain-containing protein [Sphingomonas lutea]|uniref:DUF177 domain-containing protein n=1 Tax=Sphingomonas lutea TaxID=1045317 RepID=A0A7G9SIM8_9SPHN|nr:DUF177 domain-containing protein [Sphingomonas lutea]QNN67703.1 DUF177 domain-containing protein [Sphingomonas lutea]
MSDDFAHDLRLDQLRDGDRIDLTANDNECAAIAERLGLDGLDRLEAHAVLTCGKESVRAQGRLGAALTQACVVTGDPVAAHVDAPFDILFMRDPGSTGHDEEIELGAEDCDVVFHDGATIDLGSAIADTLALSIDPYPRSAGAEATLKEAGVMTEEQASPFAVLARLKGGGET